MKRPISILVKIIVLCAILLLAGCPSAELNGQCLARGDFDGSGAFSISDYVNFINFVTNFGPPPQDLFECDLNGDCRVDELDVELVICYFTNGAACFPQFPVPTCCEPDTNRGACCVQIDSCRILHPDNCSGYYQGEHIVCGAGSSSRMCPMVCGDVMGDGAVNISDVVFMIQCIFGCSPGDWMIAGDADCNGVMTISDAVYMILYVFGGGPAPCANCI